MHSFSDVTSVNFQGIVVVFARAIGEPYQVPEGLISSDIFYNVLDLQAGSQSDAEDWAGFSRLLFPDAVRPAGMNLVNVPIEYNPKEHIEGLGDAGQPFKVLTNQEYIYLFRQAKKGTLLVNRFRLVRQASEQNPEEVKYELEPAWEVRYQRSGKPDVPADGRDTPNYLSPDRQPFIEPAFELFMVDGLTTGNFDVEFLPRNEGALLSCQVIVATEADKKLSVWSLPLDESGLFYFNVEDLPSRPRLSFQLSDESGSILALHGSPSTVVYTKQERFLNEGKESYLVKRTVRLLLAIAVGEPATLATVDLAVAADGTLAVPAAVLKAGPVTVANYTMEFDASAYVGLPEWRPGSNFAVDLWIYPRDFDISPQLIVGSSTDGNSPYIRLESGSVLSVGFMGKNSKPLSARTSSGTIRQEAWTRIQVSYDPTNRFMLRVNGDPVEVEIVGEGDEPNQTPVNCVSAPTDGFVGSVDHLVVHDAANFSPESVVGEWAFDTIDYLDQDHHRLEPPLTPNSKDPNAPGKVFGAHVIPSSSPTARSAGEVSWDDRGLAIYAAYFSDLQTYGELRGSPFLLAASDGRIHCYFRGLSDSFSVMQFDTEVSRATFRVPWLTAAGSPETGYMQFVSTHSGAVMNGATVKVSDPATAPDKDLFCDITCSTPQGVTEHWNAVPRNVLKLAAIFGGGSISDPADPRLGVGGRVWFDSGGKRPAAFLPIPNSPSASGIWFISRHPGLLPAVSVEVASGDVADTVRVTLKFGTLRWTGVECTQTWSAVPAKLGTFLETLRGLSTTYEYSKGSFSNVSTFSLVAKYGSVTASRVILFVRPTVTSVENIEVREVADPLYCQVTIVLTDSGKKTATWNRVRREQSIFALTLQGDNQDYDYTNDASGAYREVGAALIIVTDGSGAEVVNVSRPAQLAKGINPDDDLLVSASLFGVFLDAQSDPEAPVPTTLGPLRATAFQSAVSVRDGISQPITGPSALFVAMPDSLPDQGSVGLISNTTDVEDGKAALTRQGFDGGWLNQPDQRTLTFAWDNWVEMKTQESEAPSIAALTIQGDMSMELWCRPSRSREDSFEPDQRLLTFSRTPSLSEGGGPVQYLAGLRDCPSLVCNKETTLRTSFDTTEATFYVWLRPADPAVVTGMVGSVGTVGAVASVLEVSVTSSSHLQVAFKLDPDSEPIQSKLPLSPQGWVQVAVPFTVESQIVGSQYRYSFAVQLFLSGVLQGTASYSVTRSASDRLSLATMVIGDLTGNANTFAMSLNEVAFFSRAITADDIERFNEQPIPDNAPGLMAKWMLSEGEGDLASNSAPTGPAFDSQISPIANWQGWGLYFLPILGHGDGIGVLECPILRGWAHVALVHQAGYALHLKGGEFGDCGRDDSLNLGDTMSVEAWVQSDSPRSPTSQMIVAKGDDYQLGLSSSGKPFFSLKVDIGTEEQVLTIVAANPVRGGEATYLAATFESKTVASETSKEPALPFYEARLNLFVNGRLVAWGVKDAGNAQVYQRYKDPVERVMSTGNLNLGRSPTSGGWGYLKGYIADVRLWSRVLKAQEILEVSKTRRRPGQAQGLIAAWRFSEGTGRSAFDSEGDNTAKLNRTDLWTMYEPTSANAFYVNGKGVGDVIYADSATAVGGYGSADQFSFAQVIDSHSAGFYGQLDEVRIWDVVLTGEQIADNMNRSFSRAEPHLKGYWNFDNGSGSVVEDLSGRGNGGLLASKEGSSLPEWAVSTAPVSDESGVVLNILGGVPTFNQIDITETPSVIEYADVQQDAYGTIFSVMKRAYLSVNKGELTLTTGYKVGDLDTVYLGQSQSNPTLIGYLEGAPPVPAENQTVPWWSDPLYINTYTGMTSAELQDAESTAYTYNAERDLSDTHAFTAKGGLFFGGQYSKSAGIGFEVEDRLVAFEGHLGAQGGFELSSHRSNAIGSQTQTDKTIATSIGPAGSWEPGVAQDWVNPTVGRRWVPDNLGTALVKSQTVDIYGSILRSTGAMVKISVVPNPDIPVDVNLIDFPIDPKYVKNGTLDGKVGLKDDPDYMPADLKRGSYFKPLEAYALKRRIERHETQLEAFYKQYDSSRYSQRLKTGSMVVEDGKAKFVSQWDEYRRSMQSGASYDWAQHLSKRSIVNTYVWTSGGGGYAETTDVMNVYSESHGAVSSEQGSVGAVGDIQVAFPVAGFYFDFDYLYTTATQINVIKTKEQGAGFQLQASANTEGFLLCPTVVDGEITYSELPAEGKVTGYRYLAFFLAPSPDNADSFFDQVVDLNWLHNSGDANAVALREATSAATGPWRVLYRVTYVSRVPPKFQPVPDASVPAELQPVINLAYNAVLLGLVITEISSEKPTPLEMGTAVSKVLGTATNPGALSTLLPWWDEFLKDGGDYKLPAGKILRTLRSDLLDYVIRYYESRANM